MFGAPDKMFGRGAREYPPRLLTTDGHSASALLLPLRPFALRFYDLRPFPLRSLTLRPLRLERFDAVLAAALGDVERLVCGVAYLDRRVEVGAERGDADADRDRAERLRLVMREVRALDASAYALGDDARLGGSRLRQKYAELLAAVAGRHIRRAQSGLQALRGHLEREVARLVAVRVVVCLEVVNVHHHEAHREAVSPRALQLLL